MTLPFLTSILTNVKIVLKVSTLNQIANLARLAMAIAVNVIKPHLPLKMVPVLSVVLALS